METDPPVSQKRTPRPCRRDAQQEEDLREGDLGLGTSTRLDICTGTAVCTRLGEQNSMNHEQDEQGTFDGLVYNRRPCK